MKACIYLFLFMMFVPTCLAQTRYYNESKEIRSNDYTYTCEVRKKLLVTLYNTEKTYIGIPQVSLATNTKVDEQGGAPLLSNDQTTYKKCLQISNEVLRDFLLSNPSKNDVPLFVTMYINSQTGALQDVSFIFPYVSVYNTLPIDTLRTLELRLKNEMRFSPTNAGREVNYIYRRVIYYLE